MDYVEDEEIDWEMEANDAFASLDPYVKTLSALMIISSAVGICANLYVVCASSISLKNSVVNRYVLQRTLADLVFLLSVPFQVSHSLIRRWIFGDIMCKLMTGFTYASGFLSSLFLLAMNIDGYKAFSLYHYEDRLRDSKIASVVIWTLSALLSLPFFILFGSMEMSDFSFCTLVNFNMLTMIIITSLGLLILMGTMVGSLALMPFMYPPSLRNRDVTQDVSYEDIVGRRLYVALTVTYAILHFFFVLPQIAQITGIPHSEAIVKIMHITLSLPYINTALNPVIYIVMCRSLMTAGAMPYHGGVEVSYMNLMPQL